MCYTDKKKKKKKACQSKIQSSQYKALYQGTKNPRLDKEVPLTSQHASVDSGRKSGSKCWQHFLNNLISGKCIKPRLSCILPHDSRIAFLTFYCHNCTKHNLQPYSSSFFTWMTKKANFKFTYELKWAYNQSKLTRFTCRIYWLSSPYEKI